MLVLSLAQLNEILVKNKKEAAASFFIYYKIGDRT